MNEHDLRHGLRQVQSGLARPMNEYIRAARRMTFMVKAVDLTFESLYEGRALERAIWRYESLWLPLLAAVSDPPTADSIDVLPRPQWSQTSFALRVDEIRAKNFSKGGLWHSKETLMPPLDIAWVWHCHRLQPHAYIEDLKRFVKNDDQQTFEYMKRACSPTVNTAFKFSDGEDAQSKQTRRLWEIIYPFECFMPKYLLTHSYDEEMSKKRKHITSYTNEMSRQSFRSILKYDLPRAALLQKAFLHQITNENDIEAAELFETEAYLTRAYHRYLQFISLHKKFPTKLLIPMNDINIMWHMHISCTWEYHNDCESVVGFIVKHDSISVDEIRRESVEKMEAERLESGQAVVDEDLKNLEEDEIQELMEKRQRGIPIKETKEIWESIYGNKPRYDSHDTRFRGQPSGERGGFYQMFLKTNGTTNDISFMETVARMAFSVFVFFIGALFTCWAFYHTMRHHGKYLIGLPTGIGIMGIGLYIFLAIPVSRPLSSSSRYWLEREYAQTHNPLPPYLVATKKTS